MQYKSIFLLGRQPAIGRAELESIFGSDKLTPIGTGEHAMGCAVPPDEVDFTRLGSSIRLARPLDSYPAAKWADIGRKLVRALPSLFDELPLEGKIHLGISCFGLPVTQNDLMRTGLECKKAAKKAGRSLRVVPGASLALNTAQVIHNKLTGDLGIEILCIADGKNIVIAQTVAIQDIDAYAHRDQARPKRDSFVGMLPPKLAQTIVNLAVSDKTPTEETVVLDPFCGTGVVLQEALLMGYGAYGTDINQRMIDFTASNLEWLNTYAAQEGHSPVSESIALEVGDATAHQWKHPFTTVACEGYLGHPLSHWPTPDKLQPIITTCDTIARKFLANITEQVPSGTRLCIALPAWQAPTGRLHHLKTLDQIEDLGYNRVRFSWASGQDMVYRRPDQLVARELLVITRK